MYHTICAIEFVGAAQQASAESNGSCMCRFFKSQCPLMGLGLTLIRIYKSMLANIELRLAQPKNGKMQQTTHDVCTDTMPRQAHKQSMQWANA